MIELGNHVFEVSSGRLDARADELGLFVEVVNDLADLSRVGVLEAVMLGRPAIGELSVIPIDRPPAPTARAPFYFDGPWVELRAGERTLRVPRAAITAAITELSHLRAPGGTWLFRSDPIGPLPGPTEVARLRELATRADLVERLELEPSPDIPVLAAYRSTLLIDLDLCGIFTSRGSVARAYWLDDWNISSVRQYQRAALDAWRYYLSPQRASDFKTPFMPARLLDGPLAIDWFRKPPTPPASWTFERLSISSESTFQRHFESQERAGGEYFFSSGRITGRYRFRTDVAKAQLYDVDVSLR